MPDSDVWVEFGRAPDPARAPGLASAAVVLLSVQFALWALVSLYLALALGLLLLGLGDGASVSVLGVRGGAWLTLLFASVLTVLVVSLSSAVGIARGRRGAWTAAIVLESALVVAVAVLGMPGLPGSAALLALVFGICLTLIMLLTRREVRRWCTR